MVHKHFPKELSSLIHHIELNKSGWWDKGFNQLIYFVFWVNSNSITIDDLIKHIGNIVHNIEEFSIKKQVDSLLLKKIIIPIGNSKYRILDDCIREVENQIDQNEINNTEVKNYFNDLQNKYFSGINHNLWNDFYELFLIPYIKDNGANTYNIFSEKNRIIYNDHFGKLLKKHNTLSKENLIKLVFEFFEPSNKHVRSFVYSQLNMFFFLMSFQLDKQTIEYLTSASDKKPIFKIFVDTNFLFSILELHDNPSNESALRLKNIINQLENYIDIKLYVLPITIEETRRVLKAVHEQLQGIPISKNIAESLLGIDITGISKKIAESVNANGRTINSNDFLTPYISNLKDILKHKNILIFGEDLETLRNDQKIISEALEHQSYFNLKRKENEKFKSYESVEHDVVIREFAKRKRENNISNVLEAIYWILTIDYKFIAYDNYKNKSDDIQICIHPINLIQILQFWIPRNDEYESAILSNLRMPFLSHEFDKNTELITINIIARLNRFKDVSDLPTEVVTKVLIDEALREKIKDNSGEEEIIDLIENIIIKENKELKDKYLSITDEHKNSMLNNKKNENLISDLNLQIEKLQEQIKNGDDESRDKKQQVIDLENQIKLLNDDLAHRDEQVENMTIRIENIAQTYNEFFIEKENEKIVKNFLNKNVYLPLGINIIALFSGMNFIIIFHNTLNSYFILFLIIISFIFYTIRKIKHNGEMVDQIKREHLFIKFKSFYKCLMWTLAFLFSGFLFKPLLNILSKIPMMKIFIETWF